MSSAITAMARFIFSLTLMTGTAHLAVRKLIISGTDTTLAARPASSLQMRHP
jgi:hypothetical protein